MLILVTGDDVNITDVTNGKLPDSGFLWRLHSGGPSKTGRSLHSFLSVLNSKPWLGPSAIKVTNCPPLGDRDTILMVRGGLWLLCVLS